MLKDLPLPPNEFRGYVSGNQDAQLFERMGKAVLESLENDGLQVDGARILDVGCGCGRFARHLIGRPIKTYDGFDRHAGMIDWCVTNIVPIASNFTFKALSVASIYTEWDKERGDIPAEELRFPYPDNSFDTSLLSSVFTHMRAPEIENYLCELRRVIDPKGKIKASFFDTGKDAGCNINFGYSKAEVERMTFKAGLSIVGSTPGHQDWYVMQRR